MMGIPNDDEKNNWLQSEKHELIPSATPSVTFAEKMYFVSDSLYLFIDW